MKLVIREETESDVQAISKVIETAFKNHPHTSHTEQFIIKALRDRNALAISLVAEVGDKVVGHIAFSLVTVSGKSSDWYGLGPISVLPEYQRRGIGKALIRKGLSRLKERSAQGCVLVGDPCYYNRFGFRSHPLLVIPGIPQKYCLALPFHTRTASGIVAFHEAFFAEAE